MKSSSFLKCLKYRMMKDFPGHLGYHNSRKFYRLYAPSFSEALAIIAKDGSKGCCIDLGANVGKYTKLMAAKTSRVIAFEPDPWTFQILRDNVSNIANVEIYEEAAGISCENTYLYRAHDFYSNPEKYSIASSTLPHMRSVDRSKSLQVNQRDIIQFIANIPEKIKILKMDIEGSEVEILEALFFCRPDLLQRIEYIFAETHERIMPDFSFRVRKLQQFAYQEKRCQINLFWA